jgi:nickel transport protein
MNLITMSLWYFIFCPNLFAHEVNYQVKGAQGICVSFFFAGGEPMNYAEVEVYAPNEEIVFQKARTDKNGIFCFMPDKAGTWKIITKGETEHGMHGAKVEIKIKEDLSIEGFKKPLVATHTKVFIALGVVGWLVGLVGIYMWFRSLKIN